MPSPTTPFQSALTTRTKKLYQFALKYKLSEPTKSHQMLQNMLKFQPELGDYAEMRDFWVEMKEKKEEQQVNETRELHEARKENLETKGSIKSQFEEMPSVRVDLLTPNLKTQKARKWDSEWAAKKTLEDFGYGYNEDGFLVQLKNGLPFQWQGQEHYDFLGDAVKRHLQRVLREMYGLKEIILNEEDAKEDPSKAVNVFMTPEALQKEGTLLVLIQGMGAVRPPMWALSLCINTTMEAGKPVGGLRPGTMFEYQEKASELGWEYVILNPNQNYSNDARASPIEGHANPIEHVVTAYDQLISKSKAKRIVIVAHSYGGTAVVEGLLRQRESILNRLRSLVFTDSNHQQIHVEGLSEDAKLFLQQYAQNYVTSEEPCGKPLGGRAGVNIVSAGTKEHIWTSHKAWAHAFEYMILCLQMSGTPEERFQAASQQKQEGNEAFVGKDYRKALSKYARAILILSQTTLPDELREEARLLKITCHVNMAQCALSLEERASAIRHASNALELRDSSQEESDKAKALFVKAYFRRAQAYINQNDSDLATTDVEEGLKLEPGNAALESMKKKIDVAIQRRRQAEKKAFAGMFK